MVESGRCVEDITDEIGRRLWSVVPLNLGDHIPYGDAERGRQRWVSGKPRAEVDLDAVDERDGLASREALDGATEPAAGKLTVEEEPTGVGLPGVGEHVERLVEA